MRLIYALSFLLLFAAFAIAQDIREVSSSDWLVETMKKNGSYSRGSINIRLRNVALNGCKLSFDMEASRSGSNYVLPSILPEGLRTQEMPAGPDVRDIFNYSFDLSDINPAAVEERLAVGGMHAVRLETIDRDEMIDFRYKLDGQIPQTGLIRTLNIVLKKKVVPEFKKQLLSYIRLCQARPV